jgi:hypothetical protein
MKNLEATYQEALQLLRNLKHPEGLYASTIDSDNYKRVWARDSVICGIAGILADDKEIMEGLKQSLLTLAKYQNKQGTIPSNVDVETKSVSYGSLVGRVDTNTWFNIGCCLYYLNSSDHDFWDSMQPTLKKSRKYIKTIELNGKGWIYTPISGNWADEYPIHGYTLYDNSLRIWGSKLWSIAHNKCLCDECEELIEKTRINFWPKRNETSELMYHQKGYDQAAKGLQHFCSFILPGHYDTRFDAAGNGLALLNHLLEDNEKKELSKFLDHLHQEISVHTVPAFWPVIQSSDVEWQSLIANYSFDFKNKPYHFHNGGIWPVWLGLFCLGLANQSMDKEVKNIANDFFKMIDQKAWNFQEYINSNELQLKGKKQMGFTASGIVFLYKALKDETFKEILVL